MEVCQRIIDCNDITLCSAMSIEVPFLKVNSIS